MTTQDLVYLQLITMFFTIFGWMVTANLQKRVLDNQKHSEIYKLVADRRSKQIQEFVDWMQQRQKDTALIYSVQMLEAEGQVEGELKPIKSRAQEQDLLNGLVLAYFLANCLFWEKRYSYNISDDVAEFHDLCLTVRSFNKKDYATVIARKKKGFTRDQFQHPDYLKRDRLFGKIMLTAEAIADRAVKDFGE